MSEQQNGAPEKAKYDLFSPSFLADPHPVLHRMRSEDPIYWHPDFRAWIFTRYGDIQTMIRNPRFSAERVGQLATGMSEAMKPKFEVIGRFIGHWAVAQDPPRHTRIRALISKAFSPQAINALTPTIQALVDDMLEVVLDSGQMDIVRDLAFPLPANVISAMLGVPPNHIDMFKAWTNDVFMLLGAGIATDEIIEGAHNAVIGLNDYFRQLIIARRRAPTGDLLSRLADAEEQGAFLSEDELVSTCAMLMVAGHETTTHFIGNSVLALLANPSEMQKLRDDIGLMDQAVEELLRHDGSVFMGTRRALEDIEIGGVKIRANDFTFAFLQAGNRDPEVFKDPDVLDITREDVKSLTFGYGIHFCIGAALARLEAKIALTAILTRLPNLCVVGEWHDWIPNLAIRGVAALPVAFKRRAAAPLSEPPPSWSGPASLRSPLSMRAPVSVPIPPLKNWRPPSI